MSSPVGETVQWVKRTPNSSGSLREGTATTDAAPVNTTAVYAPGGSAEIADGGDTVTTQPTLYGVDRTLGVTSADKFIVDGQPYEVDGEPQDYRNPFTGNAPGLVVQLRKVTG